MVKTIKMAFISSVQSLWPVPPSTGQSQSKIHIMTETCYIWATSWENLFMPYANNKGADQPAQSLSVVRCLDSIIPLVSIRNFKPLSSFCDCPDRFESTLVANPEDRFSHDAAHLSAINAANLTVQHSSFINEPPSLIRAFTVRMKKAWVLSYPMSAQRRLWSDWASAQSDQSLRWVHTHFVGFVMSQLNYFFWQTGLGKKCYPRPNWSSLIRVYTVCHSVCIFWTHYSMEEPHCSYVMIITAIFPVSEYLEILR